ncbi:hypothetical protein FRB90_011763 [Tulasnella sp. 427]|nr:hypothetical protein FRB90_011763 [Tulasnella sp. 427]
MRNILDVDSSVRDAVLSRFVPGYRWGAAQVPLGQPDIRVDLRDLEALMLSQAIPLHIYPQHALDIISGLPPTESTGRLQYFTGVHSRFVLLLRSRAPAWSLLPEFVDDPVWRLGSTTEQWPSLRELTFPAPLSYPDTSAPPTKEKETRIPPSRASSILSSKKQQCLKPILSLLSLRSSSTGRRGHAPAYPVSHPRHPTGGRTDTYPVYSAHIRSDGVREDGTIASSLLSRRSSRKPPPPPPEYTPKALKDHRRRSRISASYSLGSAKQKTLHRLSEHYFEEDNDNALFTPPRPAHLRANSLPGSMSSRSDPSLSRMHGSASPTLGGGGSAGGSMPSPHELILAATKSKAPVCRIFVPCEELGGATLLGCEGQLVSAGIWKHLKTGDIVCNLGYVPNLDDKAKTASGAQEHWGWLVFNGESLVPYQPPLPPPDLDAFELPSPMYYTHILPSFALNPRFFAIIPPVPQGQRKREPDLTLIHLSSSMPSPATKSGVAGFARVKRFAWVGRVDGAEILATWRARAGDELHDDFYSWSGEGWATQWIVEAEGTKEGKAGLLEALDPSTGGAVPPLTEWELVRDKCTPGRLWMRLIVVPLPTESTDELGRIGS